MSCYRFIDTQQGAYPVRCLCRVLGVAPGRYHAWQQGRQRAVGEATPAWETALVAVFARHKSRYGTRRLRVALHQEGHRVGRQALRSALARRGLRVVPPKADTPRTTDSTHGLRCAPNRLLDQPKPTRANRVWVSDMTHLPLANGAWACLCAFQDVASKLVAGWHVLDTMPEVLVTTALQRAVLAQQPTPGLVVHSDRGGQYGGNAYRALLHRHEALRSHSRRGGCYDNALPGTTQAESLWSRLKTEEPERRKWPVFADLADAQASVADYFDYNNHERLHPSIDYQAPYHTHQQLLQLGILNCPA